MDFSKPYNRTEFVNFLRRDFLPDDFEQTAKNVTFGVQMNFASSAVKLGACKSLDLVVYEIKHTSHNDARVGLSKDAFRMLTEERQSRALVIFVPEDTNANYRFSLIEISLSIGENDTNVTRTYSNPRRYSYYLGEGIKCYTPNKYLNKLDKVTDVKDLFKRFSVEVLTQDFYKELSNWYFWALDNVQFPNIVQNPTDDKKYNPESVIRLVTRLIFVWFIKQKHLIPDEFFDENFISKRLLNDFHPNHRSGLFMYKSLESKYYKAILQNLFFAMLNSPISNEGNNEMERKFKENRGQWDDNKLMRYKSLFKDPELFLDLANSTVPFLNGGLFECLDDKPKGIYIDGFSDLKEVQKKLIVPDFLFFGEDKNRKVDLSKHYGDKKMSEVQTVGIIDILKRYNFTIEENTPFDKEVSLDPELLGKVFENLLAAYNPETEQTARKQTGSFYTPREIVQYMVDESLVTHLKHTVNDNLEQEYRKLLSYSDDKLCLTDDQKLDIIHSLYNCKILDPACGSGAFPVGMLQQMVHILSQLDPDNKRWKDIIIKEAINETESVFKDDDCTEKELRINDIYRSFDSALSNPDYARKLYLIERCIFGIDIQPIAIQISKLRFFISLVVDQSTNNNPSVNFGIRPLPNLEANFVAANTLIPLDKATDNIGRTPDIISIENQLKEANHKIFYAKTAKTKNKWRDKFSELKEMLKVSLRNNGFISNEGLNQIDTWHPFNQNTTASFFDPEWMFGVKNKFDIVIANPPYGANLNSEERRYIAVAYDFQDYQPETYMLFIERGLNLTKQNGCLSYIIPNTWISNLTTKKIRKHIFNDTCVNYVLHFNESVFGAIVDTDIISVSLTQNIKNSVCLYIKDENVPIKFFKQIKQRELIDKNGEACTLFVSEKDKTIINKLELIPKLSKYCKITQGSKPFQKGKGKPKQTAEIVKSKPYVSEVQQADFIPLLRGSLIGRYSITWDNNYWIKYGEWLAEPRPSANYFAPSKIVIRQTGDSIVSTIDNNQFVVRDNLYTCLPIDVNVSLKTILGLLNSKLLNWYYQTNINSEVGEALAQVKKGHLIKLPIICVKNEDIDSIVERILTYKKNGLTTEVIEYKLDTLIFKIYGLTYDEVLIIDPQTPISREEYESFNL